MNDPMFAAQLGLNGPSAFGSTGRKLPNFSLQPVEYASPPGFVHTALRGRRPSHLFWSKWTKTGDLGGGLAVLIQGPQTVKLGAFGGVQAKEYVFQTMKLRKTFLDPTLTFQSILDSEPTISKSHLLGGESCSVDDAARLAAPVDYAGLMVAACGSIGMRPICNVAEKCGADPASIFLGQAGHLSNAQLYATKSSDQPDLDRSHYGTWVVSTRGRG